MVKNNKSKIIDKATYLSNSIIKYLKQIEKFILYLSYIGVHKEPDEIKKNYILLLNWDSLIVFAANSLSGLLLILIGEGLAGLMFILSGIFWLMPLYFNRNGLTLISRLAVVFHSNVLLLIASCLFSHNSKLDTYFLIAAINCMFIFTGNEKKWLLLSLFTCLFFFIVESTSMQDYLPAYNMLIDLKHTNIILLFGQITIVSLHAFLYRYVTESHEKNLLQKQQSLLVVQKKVLIQNDDLAAFNIAASHSIQTPLYVSDFFIKKIKATGINTTEDDFTNSIEIIEKAIGQMDTLVSGLFSYNRIINIENDYSMFDIYEEIKSIKQAITPRYPTSKIIIPETGQTIISNKLLFSIILQNLIENGLKYNLSPIPQVKIEGQVFAGMLRLYVIDNGIGIPATSFERIFEPFKRIPTVIPHNKGNGLGLTGAKRAIERIGGTLICHESSEAGTVFRLDIPVRYNQEQ